MIKAPAGAVKLGQLPATAICGNDISSSCLYVCALAIVYSGKYAWVALLMVAAVLYLFRRIYGEVVGAFTLNGGAYNALLNTTSKPIASVAACLTLLSYMATAVISASEAMHYVRALWNGWPVIPATIALLACFMCLSIMGIGESSRVAVVIFITHLTALFFGFSAAMLGISGFESSANFVEEQAAGVFPKTLRNMWIVVTVFNPLTAFLALAIIPMTGITTHQEALLSEMGRVASGEWLTWLVSIDAALVLSGAVLTSFLLFMALFGLGNVLLKIKRSRLPRPEGAHWLELLISVPAVLVALLEAMLYALKYLSDPMLRAIKVSSEMLTRMIDRMNAQEFVFFTKGDNVSPEIHKDIEALDRAYVDVQLPFPAHRRPIAIVLSARTSLSEADQEESTRTGTYRNQGNIK